LRGERGTKARRKRLSRALDSRTLAKGGTRVNIRSSREKVTTKTEGKKRVFAKGSEKKKKMGAERKKKEQAMLGNGRPFAANQKKNNPTTSAGVQGLMGENLW